MRPGGSLALIALVAGLILAFPAPQSAHDIPGDVTVQAFVKPEGQRLRLLVRVPLEALSDMVFPTTGPGYLDFELVRRRNELHEAAMIWMGQEVRIFENGARLETPAITAIKVSLPSNPAFESYDAALRHVQGPLLPVTTQLPWQQAVLDVLFDYRIASDQSEFSIRPSLERMGLRVITVLRFLPPGGAERAFELRGDPGPRTRQAGSPLAPGGAALRGHGVRAHPRRHRPPAVSGLSGDPVPPDPRTRDHRDRVHRGALVHPDRFRLRPGSGCAVVPAAGRDSDRHVDRVHGVREHRRRQRGAPVGDHVRLRTRARVRVLVRPARDAAVRRQPSVDVTVVVQRRRGTWPVAGAGAPRASPEPAVQVRGR